MNTLYEKEDSERKEDTYGLRRIRKPQASLVVQWLGIHLQGFPGGSVGKESACRCQESTCNAGDTWSGTSLLWDDPTCCGATKLECHNCWACASQSPSSATREATTMRSPCSATGGQSLLATPRENTHSKEDPAQPKINYIYIKIPIDQMKCLHLVCILI